LAYRLKSKPIPINGHNSIVCLQRSKNAMLGVTHISF